MRKTLTRLAAVSAAKAGVAVPAKRANTSTADIIFPIFLVNLFLTLLRLDMYLDVSP